MAFLGAGTASAETHLCTDAGGACTAYSGEITGASTNATLSTSLASVVCSHSTTTLDAFSSTGEPIIGEVTALSFTGCQSAILQEQAPKSSAAP